jgi:hypothetical protein
MSLDRVLQPLVACLGNPVGGNPTQFVMTRLAREAELDWRFFTSQVPQEIFETAFRGIQALGMSGAAILPPFQTSVEPFLESISPNAKALGAVQVAKWESDRWIGDETLSLAILRAMIHRISTKLTQDPSSSEDSFSPQSLGVIGNQPLTQALELVLTAVPGDYSVVRCDLSVRKNKTPAEANATESNSISNALGADETQTENSPTTDRPIRALIIEQLDAIQGISSQARFKWFKESKWAQHPVAILVPPMTGWIEATEERSQWIEELESHQIELIDELEVLTHQFAINFEFWTGYEPPLDSIRESLEEYLQW